MSCTPLLGDWFLFPSEFKNNEKSVLGFCDQALMLDNARFAGNKEGK